MGRPPQHRRHQVLPERVLHARAQHLQHGQRLQLGECDRPVRLGHGLQHRLRRLGQRARPRDHDLDELDLERRSDRGFQTNVNLGGRNWSYYQGSNGANPVYSFLAHTHTTDSWVDIAAHCRWLRDTGRIGNVRIDQIQFGWEITSSAGGHNFNVNSYSLWT
ncbi:hypothetical protein GCM10029992_42020 [Glycomyces albus]